MFLTPAIGLIGLFFFVPVLAGLLLSFTDFDIYAIGAPETARFVGVGNYAQVLANPLFWKALGNTFYYVLVGGPLSVAASLGAALLVSSKLTRFQAFFRSVFFVPVVTTLVAVAPWVGRKWMSRCVAADPRSMTWLVPSANTRVTVQEKVRRSSDPESRPAEVRAISRARLATSASSKNIS